MQQSRLSPDDMVKFKMTVLYLIVIGERRDSAVIFKLKGWYHSKGFTITIITATIIRTVGTSFAIL